MCAHLPDTCREVRISLVDAVLSGSYDELFDSMLMAVGSWRPRGDRNPKLVACWPARGRRFTPRRSILVAGRATNGFTPDSTLSAVRDPAERRGIVAGARRAAETPGLVGVSADPGASALCWVNQSGGQQYRHGTTGSRSRFWQVTRVLLRMVEDDVVEANWAARLAWSNLAKIAPQKQGTAEGGGNPCWSLRKAQMDACIELLRQEVSELDPGIVLVIAGEEWYEPYARGLGLELRRRPEAEQVVHVATESGGRKWLLTNRPEYKSGAQFESELRDALSELGAQLSLDVPTRCEPSVS